MQKAEPQHGQTQQHQPAAKQGGGLAVESPQGEHIAQLEAMMDSSPQSQKLGGLAAMMNNSPAMAAQHKLADMMHNSPRQAAQRKLFDAIHNSPHQVAQKKKFDSLFGTAQRVTEEEPLQGKFETAQRVEEEEPIQHKLASDSPAQLEQQPAQLAPTEKKPNNTGLPDNLKSGIENLSGMSMDNVKVHYNSSQPAQLNALAYAQGTDIHVASGQEKHLPHEAWHVVQQAQGRVQPTMQMKDSVPVNDDKGLEHEADVMGGRAAAGDAPAVGPIAQLAAVDGPVQRVALAAFQGNATRVATRNDIPNNNPVITLGATHTGDMYQIKAAQALVTSARVNILLWGITENDNDPTVNKADSMAQYFGGGGANVYYRVQFPQNWPVLNQHRINSLAQGNVVNAPSNATISEGGATSIIMYAMRNADAQDVAAGGGGHANRAAHLDTVANAVAPEGGRGAAYDTDLRHPGPGHFGGGSYILVNFRASGHAGGAHPELDSGEQGFRQFRIAVKGKFPGDIPVPMGEYDPSGDAAGGRPNLVNYWTWPSVTGLGRAAEAGLIKYMKDHFTIKGAVGMRSGVMDLLALAGIPIVSIDANPIAKAPGGTPTGRVDAAANQKAWGWDRGMKLEEALGTNYGRAFIHDARANEANPNLPHWQGTFSRGDDDRIRAAMTNSFSGAPAARDTSHPLHRDAINDMLTQLEVQHATPAGLSVQQLAVVARLQEVIGRDYSGVAVADSAAFQLRITALLV